MMSKFMRYCFERERERECYMMSKFMRYCFVSVTMPAGCASESRLKRLSDMPIEAASLLRTSGGS